jgi:hypothetical protein
MKRLLLLGVMVLGLLFCLSGELYSQQYFDTGTIEIYVSSYGKIQLWSNPPNYDISQVTRSSILVGTGANSVFDYNNDQDIEVATTLETTPSWGDFEITGQYNNNYSGLPPNVLLKQNVYGWNNQSYAVVKYTVVNREVSSMDAILGLDLIPEVDGAYAGTDTVTYSSTTGIIGDRKTSSVGFKLLSEDIKGLGMFMYYSGYDQDTTYWRYLNYNTKDTLFIIDPSTPNVDDPVMIASLNSRTIAPGDSVTFYWAIAYGANNTDMKNNMDSAIVKYNGHVTGIEEYNLKVIPNAFTLEQNFPNPFNPSTIIKFSIPKSSNVKLTVYNTLGQQVSTLVNSQLAAGSYSYRFDAARNLSSGIYFYTLSTNNFTQTKKMLLLK